MPDLNIKHKVYTFPDGGEVQSLGYKTAEGKDATAGVITPGSTGKFDFGLAKRREEIHVIDGRIGVRNDGGELVFNRLIIFEPGQHILLECAAPALYQCIYD